MTLLSGRPQGEDIQVQRLEATQRELEGRIDTTLLRLVSVDAASAARLTELLAAWQEKLAGVRARVEEAKTRQEVNRDFEAAADQIIGLVDRLESVGLDHAPAERKALYIETVDRIELEFGEEPPAPGRKRPKRWFQSGSIKTNALLAGASRALCHMSAPRAWRGSKCVATRSDPRCSVFRS